MKVAVIGATGYVGGRLVPELLEAGHEVRCLARTPTRLDGVAWRPAVEVVAADVLDATSVERGLRGVDAVYYLVHAMGEGRDFEEADRAGAANVARAAEAGGLARIVYLGGLGDDTDPRLSEHLRSRHEVGRVLASGSVPVTELRAAVIIGSGSASFEMLRSLVEVLPVMVTPTWVTRTRCQPIAIRDVLHHLVAVLADGRTAGRVLDIGGPEVLTYREMMARYARVAGLRRRLVVPVPVLSPSLSSHWINLVTPLPIGLARPLVGSLVNDVVVRPDHDIAAYDDHRPLGFDEAIGLAIGRIRDLDVRTSWIDAGGLQPAEPHPEDPGWSGGALFIDEQRARSVAGPEELYRVVAGVGGGRGWYVATWAWRLRGFLDKLVGGVGMRRGRRHPDELRVGDALDFFRVERAEPGRRLRLRAEMRVPGGAWLEWTITPGAEGSELVQRALFHPRGLAGRLYWYALLPFHAVIFRRLVARLVAEADRRSGAADGDGVRAA